MAKAGAMLEEVYGLRIVDKGNYQKQLNGLNASGELSNMKALMTVLFRLCEIVDEQEKTIALLTPPVQQS